MFRRATSALIREFKMVHGKEAWAQKQKVLLSSINDKIGTTVWEETDGEAHPPSRFKWKGGTGSQA